MQNLIADTTWRQVRVGTSESPRERLAVSVAALMKTAIIALVSLATLGAGRAEAQLAVTPNFPVPTYPVPGAIGSPGHRTVPPPESADLARCLQSIPEEGTNPSEHALRCRSSFGEREQQAEPLPATPGALSGQPLSPRTPVSSEASRAGRARALQAFPEARKTLAEALRPILTGPDGPTETEKARALIDAFQSRYGFVQDEPSVRATADTLRKLYDALLDFERASRIQRASEQHVAYLIRQQGLPPESGGAYAAPRPLADSLKASAGQRDAAALERAQLASVIRQLAAGLDAR